MNRIKFRVFDIIADKKFYKTMLLIAVPVMVQNLVSSLLNMMDTIMVGKLGETEIASVGIANQYFFFFNMVLIGLCGGCSVFIAQYWGKKDIHNIRKILGIGIFSIIVAAFVFVGAGYFNPTGVISIFNNDSTVLKEGAEYLRVVIFSYLFTGITLLYSTAFRSIGKATHPLIINIGALIINVFLNYTLIFGHFGAPAMGVAGAAVATLISRIIEMTILILSVYVGKGALAASLKELTDVTFEYFKRTYRTILPVVLNDMCWGLASLVYIAVYGRMGTQAVASIQICNTVNNLFMVATFGLSNAAAVMIGNSIGERKEAQSIQYAKNFVVVSVITGIFLGIVLAVLSPLILNLFNVSYSVRKNSQMILYIISAIFSIRVLGIMLVVGILRGGGDAKTALYIESFTMWCIGIPLIMAGAFILKLPIYIVYSLAIAEEFLKSILSLIRLKSGKWIKNVT